MSFKKSGIITSNTFNESYANLTYIGNSVKVENGIASNFVNNSSYLVLPQFSKPSSYEIIVRFTTTKFDDGRVLGNSTTNAHTPQLEVPNGSETKLWYGHPSGSYGWVSLVPSTVISLNTWYVMKFTWDGANVKSFNSTDNGVTWTETGSVACTTCGWDQAMQVGADQGGCILNGSIDLNFLSISINGEKVYSVAPNKVTVSTYQISAEDIYEI